MKKRALVSVFYKDGILDLAGFLHSSGWEIISTGGTSKYLQENKIPVTDVSAVTGFPECLDGRVKTLHPAIHAGILARRDVPSHLETLKTQKLEPIDLVCVNLYPFFEKVQAGLTDEETIEFIDIGGPGMLRSAAKNYRDVIVLTDPADYNEAIRLDPNYAAPCRHRAFAYMQKGNYAQARTDVNKALQINPNYQNAKDLSAELQRRGHYETATNFCIKVSIHCKGEIRLR